LDLPHDERERHHKIAVLTGNDGFGASGKKQLEELAKTEGIEIVANEVYDKQATDLTDILTKVKGTPGVQAVVNWSIVPAPVHRGRRT